MSMVLVVCWSCAGTGTTGDAVTGELRGGAWMQLWLKVWRGGLELATANSPPRPEDPPLRQQRSAYTAETTTPPTYHQDGRLLRALRPERWLARGMSTRGLLLATPKKPLALLYNLASSPMRSRALC